MIQITNEDCLDLLKRYPDKHFSLAIIDGPYGIGEDGSKNYTRALSIGSKKKHALRKSKNYKAFAGNDANPMPLEYFIELQRVSENQIIWGANHFIQNIPNANSSCWIVWDKDNGNNDFADCELAWTSFNTAVRQFTFRWHGMLQQDMVNKEQRIHPCQKPVALYKWLLTKYAKPGQLILDTFIGSGSITLACHDLGYDLVGCELDTHYYEQAMKRLHQHQSQLKLTL